MFKWHTNAFSRQAGKFYMNFLWIEGIQNHSCNHNHLPSFIYVENCIIWWGYMCVFALFGLWINIGLWSGCILVLLRLLFWPILKQPLKHLIVSFAFERNALYLILIKMYWHRLACIDWRFEQNKKETNWDPQKFQFNPGIGNFLVFQRTNMFWKFSIVFCVSKEWYKFVQSNLRNHLKINRFSFST